MELLGILLLIAAETYIGMSIYTTLAVVTIVYLLGYYVEFLPTGISAFLGFLFALFITWLINKNRDVEAIEKFKNMEIYTCAIEENPYLINKFIKYKCETFCLFEYLYFLGPQYDDFFKGVKAK